MKILANKHREVVVVNTEPRMERKAKLVPVVVDSFRNFG